MKIHFSLDKLKKIFPDAELDHKRLNLITNCPSCHEKEFSISLKENHLCGCFRKKKCGWTGNIYTLLKEIGRLDVLVNRDIDFKKLEKGKLVQEQDETLDLQLPTIPAPIGWYRVQEDPYLEGRGLGKREFQKYKIGKTAIDPRLGSGYIVFLIEEEGECKGYIGRSKKSKSEIERLNALRKQAGKKMIARYVNSSTEFSKIALGVEELTEATTSIIFVEGIFDKIRVDQLLDLDNDEEMKCICTFKCAISLEQIYKIHQKAPNIKTVILMYDPDVIKEIKAAAFELVNYFPNVLVAFSENGKDPGDFEMNDMVNVLDQLQTPFEFANSKNSFKKLKI